MAEKVQTLFDSECEVPIGKWYAMVDNRVVAISDSTKQAFEEAKKKCPGVEIFIAKLPEHKTMVF